MASEKWIEEEEILQRKMSELKVQYQRCTTLTITVVRGRKISAGWLHDLFDTPDAQVYLTCETAIGRKSFKTKIAKNTRNPEWNETFTFILSEDYANSKVKVDVYEEDKFKHDPHLGDEVFKVEELELGKSTLKTIDLGKNGQVDIELLKQYRTSPDFRLSLGLSDGERKFRMKRKQKTMEALQKFLGEEGPESLSESPTIALAITGGGYRAVATSCGAMEALAENGLVDSLMYVAGLSGSSWYIATTYLHKAMANRQSLIEHHDWLRKQMERSLANCLFDLSFYKRYMEYRDLKKEHNQPTTFVDFYGLALGETFLGCENTKVTLSSLRSYVDSASVPFPILTCAHVREYLPMSEFWDEVEMTPYEVSLPSYGINIPTEQFNSSWGNGILQKELPEPPLHYLMGASGSAFAILLSKVDDKSETSEVLQTYVDSVEETHHKKKDGADKVAQSDSSSEDDEAEETQNSVSRGKETKNFSSPDDDWIEQVKLKAEARANGEKEQEQDTIGRAFLLERTAKVKNCATSYMGLEKFRFNTDPVSQETEASVRIRRKISTKKRNIMLCDSALGCNLPSVHVVRPQREVDVLIVVDCSNYSSEKSLILELFATVQSQIYDHGIKFPRISIEKIAEDPFREFYLFEDTEDPDCPMVLWFTMADKKFKEQKNPHRRTGYPTPDDVDSGKVKFTDFSIFPESSDFGTLRLSFSPLNFDRLRELMRFNIVNNMDIVREKIGSKVKQMKERKEQRSGLGSSSKRAKQ
uniref:cytosolic phospholipase A2-like n=1 Tax=Styela clava TaxID=7725 RepID=UPI00193969E5|nr:cytosolic phospholipase A2-like [Styela clava]